MWKMHPISDAQLVCISNFPTATYSGMMPGVLAGQYPPAAMEIDLVRLCQSAGARLIVDEVTGLDTENQTIEFRNRPALSYQILSIGVGSKPTFAGAEVAKDSCLIAVKPMQTFLERLDGKLDALTESSSSNDQKHKKIRIVVVGGGIGSIEIAFAMKRRLRDQDRSFEIGLVTGSEKVGAGLTDSTKASVKEQLQSHGIDTHCGQRVAEVHQKSVRLADGKQIDADIVIWATSAVAPELLGLFDLDKDAKGFISTKPTLQSVSNDRVFAVGDSGTIVKSQTAKAGVFAVRQGKILWKNILQLIQDKPLVEYHPQKKFLKLINTADGKSIAEYGNRTFHSPWAWKLKNRIDSKFVAMYQDYTLMPMKMSNDSESEMRCLGCGGKIGSQILSAVLDELEVPPHEDVVIGLENPDDAAVIRTHGNQVTVTTDFFASPMNDPYLVGRIACLNSISDCFVMGAQPTAALAMVQLPFLHPRAQLQFMRELMAGSIEELKRCGATIVGGHSIEGPRLTIGFTVMGRQLVPAKTKGMLNVGDQLILTKPLGTGVMLAALMQCQMAGLNYQPLVDAMLKSNQIALPLITDHVVSGITDVTGFGLAGHLAEMLNASNKSARIAMRDIPILPGCQELIEQNIESTLAPDNRAVIEKIGFSGIDVGSRKTASLFDPQTSGGLLFGVAEANSTKVLKFLADNGFDDSAVIGEVVANQNRPSIEIV
jgi:selenide,water dikinase